MLNLSMRQLRAIAAIARLRNFTRAAEQLHITQAGLSSLLRDVERQLGCRLFERTTRAVSLTPHGASFLPIAARVLAEMDGAAQSLGRLSSLCGSRLVVGATPLVASAILPAACRSFAVEHPQVAVTVHDLERGQIHGRVRDGELDAGFGVFLEAASGVRRVPLLTTQLVLVSPRTEPPAATADAAPGSPGRLLRWTDLQSVPLLSLPVDNPIQLLVDRHLAPLGRGNEARRAFNHLHTLLAMVEAGAGCAVLPSFIQAAVARYRVSVAPLSRPKVDVDFYEITKTGRPRSPIVSAFGRHLVAAMAVPPAG